LIAVMFEQNQRTANTSNRFGASTHSFLTTKSFSNGLA